MPLLNPFVPFCYDGHIKEKPAGLLGKRSIIPEELNLFLALENWAVNALKKQEELSKQEDGKNSNQDSSIVSGEPVTVEEGSHGEMPSISGGMKESQQEPCNEVVEVDSDIDELTGSDAELKFSSDEEEEDDDDSTDEKGSDINAPSAARKLCFDAGIVPSQDTKDTLQNDDSQQKRKPPMLGT